ncbi:amino acid adenylation domain-containing protein [Hymenobacter sp. RP-2-7]|uniref:Amino acid adenylation domain-containing protein n=1 Tax=Hymenobacter polaris TaxID=2682546 RepID=A0A7Y0FLV5_9BACT|nr:polyketide synthase [Hymenobacter polaris]NML64816.1 amino acid adenylation domain-containing protein [Hymenobacter polaris]
MSSPESPLPDLLVHELVERAVATYGPRPAVVFEEAQLSYQQLNERADALCQAILHAAPAAELIGISAVRGLEMVVGLLAILKAGKTYLPLDPTYPAQRLRQLIASSGVATCLAHSANQASFEALGLSVLASEADYHYPSPRVAGPGREVVCVLYTSGSTGQPKGVRMTQTGLRQLMRWQMVHNHAQPELNTLQFCHLTFDVSFLEVFLPLVSGGTVHLIGNTYRLDAGRLLAYIRRHAIHRAYLPYVALQYLAEAATTENSFPESLREISIGGEQLKITAEIRGLFAGMPGCTLMHVYGPAEGSIWVTEHKLAGPPAAWPDIPHMGWPILATEILILDESLAQLPAGESGEICLTGDVLAAGYLHDPAQTAARFVQWPHPSKGLIRIYRTGDMARYRPDGSLEFTGRRDDQVKIRGNRVELGEIEVVLNRLALLRESVVVIRPSPLDGQKQVVAYLVAESGQPDDAAVRQAIAQALPDYMMPAALVWLPALPRTISDKVDKKLLPDPGRQRPATAAPYRPPATALERLVASEWAALLQLTQVGADDNFFELGGNSLLAQKTVAALKQAGHALPITKLYQYPTAAGLARFLGGAAVAPAPAAVAPPAAGHGGDVAIVGMAGRFPGAGTVAELWEVLREGRETIHFFSDDELDATIAAEVRHDPLYVKARGVLAGADRFDAAFFGLNPRLAELMDPQQRVFLEIAWEALEQTGHLPHCYAGPVGVFAGVGSNTYYQHNVLPNPQLISNLGALQVHTANEKDYVATRTAYQLNLTGPAVSVYSACSTSLLAVAQAVQSIRAGQCTVALAGGASITSPVRSGHLYQEGAMLSHDGHCRPFDAQARGTVFSDGAGVVVLKSLAAARQDGDPVLAIIKGVGVNNDGGGKGSFTAPSAEGQAGAIGMALRDARVAPASIGYVEAHGTGTPLGDPIEVAGLRLAYGDDLPRQSIALGSIKSNLGHLTHAAGVAGLIKTTLALHHGQLPASLGFAQPNPHLDLDASPFRINHQLAAWPAGEAVRRAGVSSFGVGGTNVHVVLEEGEPAPVALGAPGREWQLVTWSARSATSREAYAARLADHLAHHPAPALADVAYTLQKTRPPFAEQRFAVAGTAAELAAALRAPDAGRSARRRPAPGEVVFLFPGQGAQYLGMGHALYQREAVYRRAVDECAALLVPALALDIREVLYPTVADEAAALHLHDTRYTQPALFVTEYALAQLWLSWGIVPTVLCGHSVGEFVAAHLAGVFTLADALGLVAARGRLVSALPGGRMLSVRLEREKLLPLLPAALAIAAVNSPKVCVVAGEPDAIDAFAQALGDWQVPHRQLATSHAFHSPMMDPVVDAFRQLVAALPLGPPQRPIVSTVTGQLLTDAQATDPDYWARHLRQPVLFAQAVATLLTFERPLLLEVGPGTATATLARQQVGPRPVPVVASLAAPTAAGGEPRALLEALGQLWLHGLAPDWEAFYAGQARRRVLLPTYAFDAVPCWVAPPKLIPELPVSPPIYTAELTTTSATAYATPTMQTSAILPKLKQIIEEASGIELDNVAPEASFLEIGLDSLLLTQVATTLKKEFSLPLTFRQLNEEYGTLASLGSYLGQHLPADVVAAPPPRPLVAAPAAPAASLAPPAPLPMAAPSPVAAGQGAMLGLVAQQLQLLAQQVSLLQVGAPAPAPALPAPVAAPAPLAPVAAAAAPAASAGLTPEEVAELKKPFGATARIERQATGLSASQQLLLRQLTERYNRKTQASKAYAQQHRARMADPRVVSGFRPLTKELVYPLVVNRSQGSRLWDLDGNEYIDVLNGFGSTMFGYQPDFIKEALHAQIERGFEIGPQHELAGEVSELLCEFTGFERVGLCNTGSEAVLGAMRIARSITGRSLIVAFTGSYHGIVDEVLVRGTRQLKSFPAASGILPSAVQNMLILDYGTDESLRIIRERAHELAAVLVEPVQSRRPDFQPVEFLKQVRAVTAAAGTALIFDEIITGFRLHPGGAQALFGIRADLATYGKVVGGGLSLGIIAGQKEWLDALDGGHWQYGDASVPEVGVTYFAGTFVRHPLALAAAKASLLHLRAVGPALQQGLTAKTEQLARGLNAELAALGHPFEVVHFGSLWKIKFTRDVPYGELLFTLMRERGIHIWDGFPCFTTEAHTEAELAQVATACLASAYELAAAGFWPLVPSAGPGFSASPSPSAALNQPPAPGARLGRDAGGNPAWFVADAQHPGGYRQLSV